MQMVLMWDDEAMQELVKSIALYGQGFYQIRENGEIVVFDPRDVVIEDDENVG